MNPFLHWPHQPQSPLKFTCAQRGCVFSANEQPQKCPTCGNPFRQNESVGPPLNLNAGERPTSQPDPNPST